MLADYVIFLVILFIVAALVRDDFIFTVLYLFAGAYLLGRLWSGQALKAVTFSRDFVHRAFYGEEIPVRLEVTNGSVLPLVWRRGRDALPIELLPSGLFSQVVSLGPRGRVRLEYHLQALKRGYYPIGPLAASSGDLFGMADDQQREGPPDFLTVYPNIIPLTSLRLPSRSPLGTLRHHQPIFEDPSRVLSKRDYIAGDSLRRVDWKATATTGRLQVKQFEPSMALETAIFLNLNASEYALRSRIDATELAIVVAASIANWVVGRRQAVGLYTNGLDPLASEFPRIPPRKGRGHLMRILDILARVQAHETLPMPELLHREVVHLSWGTSLILIAGQADDQLFDQIFQSRRAGMNAVLILAGPAAHTQDIQRRADTFGVPAYFFARERDLDVWRQ